MRGRWTTTVLPLILFSLLLDDIDEVEVYGHHEEAGVELTSYTFEVREIIDTEKYTIHVFQNFIYQ